jgi:hypothetical protein
MREIELNGNGWFQEKRLPMITLTERQSLRALCTVSTKPHAKRAVRRDKSYSIGLEDESIGAGTFVGR